MKLGAYGAARGHLTRFDEEGWQWVYADDLSPVGEEGNKRFCTRCGKYPSDKGHDACIANLPSEVVSACCGHGIEIPYVMFVGDSEIDGDEAVAYFKKSKEEHADTNG